MLNVQQGQCVGGGGTGAVGQVYVSFLLHQIVIEPELQDTCLFHSRCQT